ncbi:unnamed protein product [Rotaria socialis]|uniref:LIM zinc-binding domain-containing protein n=1 Tax=Rotaria socialis TaxID=392032 RepID=A0A818Y8C7_9BILA|nr:unnamed protein product [Rotaria socialis]CAF3393290.1 unnamed protein product [Rotaria socialis]CAF3436287.1 unnamed protein product [Rotaria socialis]CAF3747500.1 unnamed protein product [Rotaria socialis]CAF3753005.1 unnamed protein product [Rotaria socialis]
MPFKSAESVPCPRCGHATFHAESVPAAGKLWHKTCFRCGLCKKMLEMPTLAENDGDIYCKQCYTRKFGIRGVGFGIGAGALGMDAGERFGNTQSTLSRHNYPPMPHLAPTSSNNKSE